MIHLKSTADDIKGNDTLQGMYSMICGTMVSFSPLLQLCVRKCSTTSINNSKPPKFFLDVAIIRKE